MKNFILIAALFLVGCSSIERLAIPKRELTKTEFEKEGKTLKKINHSTWDSFLKKYTQKNSEGVVLVKYSKVTKKDHQKLKAYIDLLSTYPIDRFSRNEQLAFYANIYNAKTVDVILDHYPVKSIREIKDGFFDLGPWNEKRLRILNHDLSLHDLEHKIVRPIWKETPEIHYVLNCAAIGCPNLSQAAYTSSNIQRKLKENAASYVNDPRGVTFKDRKLYVSKIFNWYRGDFGGCEKKVIRHLQKYAQPELKRKLQKYEYINSYFYDWTLNDSL